jgi:hypothetical protein
MKKKLRNIASKQYLAPKQDSANFASKQNVANVSPKKHLQPTEDLIGYSQKIARDREGWDRQPIASTPLAQILPPASHFPALGASK